MVLILWVLQVIGYNGHPSDSFWQYDCDDAYFNSDDDDMDIGGCGDYKDNGFNRDDMDISNCDDDMNTGAETNSEHDSEKEEFWFVFLLIGEMVAYFQRHYDKRLMRTSILSGKYYMAEMRDCNPTNCHDMFRMTLDLFYHLVDELKHHGHLKEGKGVLTCRRQCPYSCTSSAIILGFDLWQTDFSIPLKLWTASSIRCCGLSTHMANI